MRNSREKCSAIRRNTVRKAGDSPVFSGMSSRSTHGRAPQEVRQARMEAKENIGLPFFGQTDSLAPSILRRVLVHVLFPSKDMTPWGKRSCPNTFFSNNSFTIA